MIFSYTVFKFQNLYCKSLINSKVWLHSNLLPLADQLDMGCLGKLAWLRLRWVHPPIFILTIITFLDIVAWHCQSDISWAIFSSTFYCGIFRPFGNFEYGQWFCVTWFACNFIASSCYICHRGILQSCLNTIILIWNVKATTHLKINKGICDTGIKYNLLLRIPKHNVRNSIWLTKNRASDNEGKFHSFLMFRIWIYNQKSIS